MQYAGRLLDQFVRGTRPMLHRRTLSNTRSNNVRRPAPSVYTDRPVWFACGVHRWGEGLGKWDTWFGMNKSAGRGLAIAVLAAAVLAGCGPVAAENPAPTTSP